MREPSGRARATATVLLGTIFLTGISFATVTAHPQPAGIDRFLYALGQVESGGNYTARNPTSGAYGKYQIMPYNWRPWAKKYLGNANARQTPRNQERVAKGKVHDLHGWLDTWRVVAHWWLTGSSSRNEATWSSYSKRYVNKIMKIYKQGAPPADDRVVVGDANSRLDYDGRWGRAGHRNYSADTIRWSNTAGSTVSFTFKGTSIAWIGPRGPTRGKARVYLDGKLSRTVDLYASGFRARNTIFARSWQKEGEHTITIEVVGTPHRPTVGIDEFRFAR